MIHDTLDGHLLIEGKHYSVSYQDNDKPGTAFATVEGLGYFSGSVEVPFLIKEPHTLHDITVIGGSAMPPSAREGEAVALTPDSAPDNKVFDHWEVVSGSAVIDGETFTMPNEDVSIVAVWKDDPSLPTISMYRLYNQWSYEHFYTGDEEERDFLVSQGWTYEGIGWTAPAAGDPVYRLYNKWAPGGDHHYTMDVEEYDYLVSVGWSGEGIGWYSDPNQTVPVYREYNPWEFSHNHNYTADRSEHDALMNAGWNDEGIGWYGV